jgi:hypothetical protein
MELRICSAVLTQMNALGGLFACVDLTLAALLGGHWFSRYSKGLAPLEQAISPALHIY